MPLILQQSEVPTVASDEEVLFEFLVDAFPSSSPAQQRSQAVRFSVDAVEIPIKSFSFDEGEQDIAATLEVELPRHADRSLITRDSVFKFETSEAGVWTTRIDTGRLQRSDYQLSGSGADIGDTFKLTAKSLIEARLETSPLNTVVLYDPAKLTVNESEFIGIADIDGVDNPVTIVSTAGLSTHSLFDYAADICGFAGVVTNIPDFPLRRIDFTPGDPYFDTINGVIGLFEPQFDIDSSDNLVIREGTNDVLATVSAAKELTVDYVSALSDSRDIVRFKGTLLTYQEQGTGWDYMIPDVIPKTTWFRGIVGQYPMTQTETVVNKYYRRSFPNTPVFTRVVAQRKWVRQPFQQIAATAEIVNYNDTGLITSRERREFGWSQAPDSWVTFCAGIPGPGYDPSFESSETAYMSAGDDTFSFGLVLTKTSREAKTYLAHPYKSDEVYCSTSDIEERGLITRDSTNQQLGADFDQSLQVGLMAGNLVAGLGSYWGRTGGHSEAQSPAQNRQLAIRTSQENSLNADGESFLSDDYTDDRTGDIGISINKAIQKQAYVFDEGDPAAKRIQKLNGGEAPLSILRPLATRLNRRQYYPGRHALKVPGMDWSLVKGRAVNPKDRQGASFGTYRITGRNISGSEGKFETALTAKQIGSAEVVAESSALNDSFSIAIESGQSKIIPFNVQCFTGNELSGESVADLAVEARHGASGGWTNIETTPIDLSPYDGSTELFQVQITAGTVTTPFVRSFTLRNGPA